MSDCTAGDVCGVLLSSVTGNGVWSFSTDAGTTWKAVDTNVLGVNQALALAPTNLLRYTPGQVLDYYSWTVSVNFVAWSARALGC